MPIEALRTHLQRSFPKFWVPDRFVAVAEVPKTSVGKIDKATMRRRMTAEE